MIKLEINNIARSHLAGESSLFDNIEKTFYTTEEARDFLIERYGKLPKGRNKIYVDGKAGQPIEIGFTHSFWNKDWSHNSKSWYQTDWICAVMYQESPVNILKD